MENKKSLIAIVLVALVGIIGATFAYFTSTSRLTNTFQTGTYSTSVKETFISPDNWTPGTTTTKKVNVTNNGSIAIAVRAKYTEKWTASNGTVLSGTRNGEKVAQFTVGSDWIASTDGYYYYNGTLTTGQTSSDFISSITFNPNFSLEEGTDIECTTTKANGKTTVECANLTSGYAGATYSLDITIETIQSDRKWSYVPTVYTPGFEITIGNERFNVISDNGSTVTMLAAFNLGSDYKQSSTANYLDFSNGNGWSKGSDINIQLYEGNAKKYVNNYVTYLQGEIGATSLSGTLMTLSQIQSLGCTNTSCSSSPYSKWLNNGQKWWTRTSYTGDTALVYAINGAGVSTPLYDESFGIRPLITISKEYLNNL